MPTVRPSELESTITAAFVAAGAPEASAHTVASHLVDAELAGVTSHGVIRVAQYLEGVRDGAIRPDASPSIVRQLPAMAVVDGGGGFGQVAARFAMDVAIDKAREQGVACVSMQGCGHTGRLAAYTEQAVEAGMLGMMMVNAGGCGQWMAPFGGSAGRLATNPISVGIPASDAPDIVLDFATSAAPEGKVRARKLAGQDVPEGWIADHAGNNTTDPNDLYGPPRGALLPFGGREGYKGFGLALMVEAFAGGLSGAGCCHDPDAPMGGKTDGVFMLAIRPDAFNDTFGPTVGAMVSHVRSSPPAAGFDEVLIPGELEARQRARQAEALVIDDGRWATVADALAAYDITPLELT